ncbi:polyprenyl synthetase family protein [Candidatus Margulisiibacteriota bacterium]
MNVELSNYLKYKEKIINDNLGKYVKAHSSAPSLSKAIRYSLLAPGKRIRPILTLAVADMFGKKNREVIPAACAIEMIHVYSLIHDDLPAMDNDDLRRGKPTNHKVFGEALAILAGDTLQAEAFGMLAKIKGNKLLNSIISELAYACGTNGMAAGQALDLQAENKKIKLNALYKLHSLKTGRLLRAAVRIGAILSGAKPRELKALTIYAESLGLAFQIQDDLLDVLGETNVLGKRAKADIKKNKATYPRLLGIEKTKVLLAKEIAVGKKALKIFGPKAKHLVELIDYVKERKN